MTQTGTTVTTPTGTDTSEVVIDGAEGEGGGQILRTALALSLITGRTVRLINIRARRKPPGLRPQHLAAVQAAACLGSARLGGAAVGSTALDFVPGQVSGGHYHFDIGTAGSTTLVLQTLVYPLLTVAVTSTVVVTGGTHNPMAPPFEYLAEVFAPLLNRLGPTVTFTLERYGFAPVGGGRVRMQVQPAPLHGISLNERGAITHRRARVLNPGLPDHIATRELDTVRQKLRWPTTGDEVVVLADGLGPANLLLLGVTTDHGGELITGFGQRGVAAETVAARACLHMKRFLRAEVPVGEHLADQLLLPLALAGKGEYLTVKPSSHTVTQARLIPRFLPIGIDLIDIGQDQSRIRVYSAAP